MIIFDPEHFPPTSPEHVRFSPGTEVIIESMVNADAFDLARLRDLGESVGRVLYANVYAQPNAPEPNGDFIREIGRSLTRRWDGDSFDKAFQEGLNWGMQNEHADTVGGLYPEEGEDFI